MILGIGIDIISVDRIRTFTNRHGDRGRRRLFTPGELADCLGRADPAESLAARFAAKEAFFKAVRAGWGAGGDWTEVEVVRGARGAPSLALRGRAAEAVRTAGATRTHLSLTHAGGIAAAVVVLES
jgi:holo-[acyl-carrier protein] synthase